MVTNHQNNEEDHRGQSVRRWLYAGLGAVVLLAGGTVVVRTGAVPRILGLEQGPGTTQQADATVTQSRKTFEKDTAALSQNGMQLAALSIPTDNDGYFAPPLESEMPGKENGAAIRRGREIFLNPAANAADYVGNSLACANCHLDAGRRANAAPMWAASGLYPKYRGKNDQINTMEDRINGCFTYSMNAPESPSGGPPPEGDQIYKDLESYMHWLATGAPSGVTLPGQGYPTPEKPAAGYDRVRGAQIFDENCSVCHGADGEGRQDLNGRYVFPPLWGPDSYNWGAGMHRVNTAAGFIYANMPLGQPYALTPQQAWDVAAYINSQERPADPRQPAEGLSVAEADAQYHDHEGYYGDTVGGSVIGAGVPADPTGSPSATGTVVPAN